MVVEIPLLIIFTLVLIVVTLLLIRWKISYSVLSGCGIKGPSPVLYYGNGKEIRTLGLIKFIETYLKKYGNMFGFYVGIRPTIAVKDLEMLKQILVKQFDTFTDRQIRIIQVRKRAGPRASGIFSSRGEDWRRLRKILSKSFNAISLSKMSPLIEKSCESLVIKLGDYANTGKSFDIWKLYGLYTMEVILAAGFGHSVDVVNGEADELAEASASIFAYARTGSNQKTTIILSNFPFLERFVTSQALKTNAAKNAMYIEEKAKELIRNRLDKGQVHDNYQDLLQLLIDARADSDDEDEVMEDPYKKKLTDIEIVLTSISFLLAGHETTNNALGYTSYLLALNPDKQEKLFQEISEFYSKKPDASLYEAAQSLSYADMVIQESLRLYPPAPVTTRLTAKTFNINGQVFPKDSVIVIPIREIHLSPDIWPDPFTFKPERFAKEEKEKRHQMAHMPFGWGPRSCIGMRLALMEAKMALITIMKEYKFVEAPDTEKPLKMSFGITMIPVNGIYLMLERR